jgi:hypothetical protein
MLLMLEWPDEAIVHYSYSPDHGTLMDAIAIEDYHVDVRGFSPPGGYHFTIERVGGRVKTSFMRSLKYQGAHTLGHNDTIGICVIGYYDKVAPDEELLVALEDLIAFLDSIKPLRKITGHFEYSDKTCPGKMFPMERFARGQVAYKPKSAYTMGGLIIKEAQAKDIYLLRKYTTVWDAPGFDGINGCFFNGEDLLGVAYDRGMLYYKGVSWRPPRACMIAYPDGLIQIQAVQDITHHQRYKEMLWAIGGFSSDATIRKYEQVGPSVPEGDKRPRTAMAFKGDTVHLITTKPGVVYTLPDFEDQMAAIGFKHPEWMFMDGGSSTQSYFHNNGKPVYKRSYKRVPLLVGVKRV